RKAIMCVTTVAALAFGAATAAAPVSVSPSAGSFVSGAAPALPLAFTRDAWNVPAPGVSGVAPDNALFYDRPLMLRQYGFGVLSASLAVASGFYMGNAFEGAIFGNHSRKGFLSFTGIRAEHSRRLLGLCAGGPFLGGSLGMR